MKRLIRRIVLWAIADDLRAERELATQNAVAQGVLIFKPKHEPPPAPVYIPGDRVKASDKCRFHRGFKGVVSYVEPSGRLWVRRDGTSSDCFYDPEEVERALWTEK